MSFGLQYNPTEENRFTHRVTNSYMSQTNISAHSLANANVRKSQLYRNSPSTKFIMYLVIQLSQVGNYLL